MIERDLLASGPWQAMSDLLTSNTRSIWVSTPRLSGVAGGFERMVPLFVLSLCGAAYVAYPLYVLSRLVPRCTEQKQRFSFSSQRGLGDPDSVATTSQAM